MRPSRAVWVVHIRNGYTYIIEPGGEEPSRKIFRHVLNHPAAVFRGRAIHMLLKQGDCFLDPLRSQVGSKGGIHIFLEKSGKMIFAESLSQKKEQFHQADLLSGIAERL